MVRYEEWLDRAKSSYELAHEKAVKIAKDCLDWVENKIAGNNSTSE
jgi:hypothetical protein